MTLMVTRSAGLVTIVISLILSLGGSGEFSRLARLGWVIGGTVLLWLLAQSRFLDRYMSRGIHWSLRRWTDLDTHDYASLLNVHGSYRVNEIRVKKGDWLAGKRLRDCRLPDEGVTVLGIYRPIRPNPLMATFGMSISPSLISVCGRSSGRGIVTLHHSAREANGVNPA